MITLFEYPPSGNCYKVRLILNHLQIPFERKTIDTRKGETRTDAFRAMNSNGKVPVVQLDDGSFLPESNAILYYFAEGTPYLPDDRLDRAHVLRWMFFEQYSHEPYIAVARNWLAHVGVPPGKEQDLKERQQRGYAALDVMERHLTSNPFFVKSYSIADIALYAYTHVAGEGGFDLSRYPAIRSWFERVKSQPRHIALDK